MNKKIIIIALVILGLTGLIYGAVRIFGTSSTGTDRIEKSTQYSNTTYKFIIQHPESLYVAEERSSEPNSRTPLIIYFKSRSNEAVPMVLQVTKSEPSSKSLPTGTTTTQLTLNSGKTAKYYNVPGDETDGYEIAVIKHGDVFLLIENTGFEENAFKAILSDIKLW